MARSGLNKAQIEQIARHQTVQQMQVMGVQYSYSGPLPPPEVLERFEKIVPGGAERIFKQFESQTAHRQMLEAKVISSNAFVQIFGAIGALILGLLAIGGGLYLVHEGKSLAGFGAFFGGLASLVSVYIIGKRSQVRELKGKQGS